MNINEKRSEISLLFDFYSAVLTERQREVLDFYYNEDLSLSEIAENLGITRQGVRDAIIHGEEYLYFLEKNIKMAEHDRRVRETAYNIINLTRDENIIREAEKLIN
ncbi:MAG: sigma factor-like helix-turn-helix DNA-binding protein [Eubacteriales bacterium]|nr:sigma factor-like helix-turn-helix DNA-binding protein [Eubacteriales bacterium]